MDAIETLRRQAAAWGLPLDAVRVARIEAFARMLSEHEEANVIGTRDLRGVILDHILDSLSCFLFEPLRAARTLVDVGSGGGLPGLAIKIAEPALGTTLVEATGKKARFIGGVVEGLSLGGVEVVNARVEEVAREAAHRGVYDVATARAVARLSVVAEYCVPLLRVGGHVISMKARLEDEEIAEGERAAERLGARFSQVIRVSRLPELEEKERRLVILEKVVETPAEYPRSVGVPARRPLGVV